MKSWKTSLFGWLFGGPESSAPPTTSDSSAIAPVGTALAAGATDTGRERENNEDSFLCDPERGLFLICDGMGGMAAGEQASREAIRFLTEFLTAERIAGALKTGKETVTLLLQEALQAANNAVRALLETHPEWEGLGSTAVLGLLDEGTLHLANMGDSRAYLIRAGTPQILTTDHSVAAALVAHGDLTEKEARTHSLRNHLTAALGHAEFREPATRMVRLRADDRIVFCSDGLWDMMEDAEIARITAHAASPSEAVCALIQEANRAGGNDNITVIVLHIPAVEKAASEAANAEAAGDGETVPIAPEQEETLSKRE